MGKPHEEKPRTRPEGLSSYAQKVARRRTQPAVVEAPGPRTVVINEHLLSQKNPAAVAANGAVAEFQYPVMKGKVTFVHKKRWFGFVENGKQRVYIPSQELKKYSALLEGVTVECSFRHVVDKGLQVEEIISIT